MKTEEVVYIIETPGEVFWSRSKIDATYRHVEFLYKDKARYKEVPSWRFAKMQERYHKPLFEIIA